MPAAYDYYDYPKYWKGREYEHESEVIAIKGLLQCVPEVNLLLDIGCGYGRLTPTYIYRAKKIILSDPSGKLLSQAREALPIKANKKFTFIQSKLENLHHKIRPSSVDLILMVRVAHHLCDLDTAFRLVHRSLSPRGYFILEYANKKHFKAVLQEFFHGNLTFPLDIFSRDIRCTKNIKKNTLPFINYHPDEINKKLADTGFEIIKTLSVSNIRSSFLKKVFPLDTLLSLEGTFQTCLARVYFGPSIMILARKKPFQTT